MIKSTQSISIILTVALFLISFSPLALQAQTTSGTTQTTTSSATKTTTTSNSQALGYQTGVTTTTSTDGTKTISTNLLNCSAGALLAEVISTGVQSLVSDSVTSVVVSQVVPTVPINTSFDPNTIGIKQNSNTDLGAHTAQTIAGVPFGSSLDAMGWCVVNSIISYIADSTIAWANSGFNGSPAFLDNPENFFQSIADTEAARFIQNLAYNTGGINVCEPFRVNIALGLAQQYNTQYRGSCTLDTISNNFKNFTDGNATNVSSFWSTWNQASKPENNQWTSYIINNQQLRASIRAKNNTATFELGLNKGWLNFKKCEDKTAAENGDTSSCKTYTPGSLIESSLEKTLDVPKDRLVAVQKFDQVITAIVNNLIKVALNEVLSSSSN